MKILHRQTSSLLVPTTRKSNSLDRSATGGSGEKQDSRWRCENAIQMP